MKAIENIEWEGDMKSQGTRNKMLVGSKGEQATNLGNHPLITNISCLLRLRDFWSALRITASFVFDVRN